MSRDLAVGLAVGTLADQLFGDPRRGHPVALFGRAAQALETRVYRDTRPAGVLFTGVCVGSAALFGVVAQRSAARPLVVAVATWAVLGSRSLPREAAAVGALLAADDLPGARQRLTHLVGRETGGLDESGVSRAVIESVAENSSDAVVAPLLWGAVAGVPGLLAYRAANTLDAMVGHRSPRYTRFGWASARLDDVANLAPARLTAVLVALVAPTVSGSPAATLRAARRWGRAHPSPNAGFCESAFAGALGLRLGGRNVYAGRVDDRPVIGDGRPPVAADITRASRLLRATTLGAAVLAVAIAAGRR